MIQIGAVCCIVLLTIGGTLWWITRARTADGSVIDERTSQRRATPHPRLDLAAGMVASSQSVHHPPRRQGIQAPETAEAAAPTQANRANQPRRPDWAYSNQDNGDLSDPEPGGVPAGGVQRPTGSLSRPER